MNNTILTQARHYVNELFTKELLPEYTYHNWSHTKRVTQAVTELAIHEQCTEEEIIDLMISAFFHDTGYTQQAENHEEIGATIAEEFLTEQQFPQERINQIKQLILATQKNVEPTTQLEKIIKDADCSHVASSEFEEISEHLRKEISTTTGNKISSTEWLQGNLEFLNKHQFYTETAQQNWQEGKEVNQNNIQQKLNKKLEKKKKKEQEAEKPKKLGRGIETLFRVQLKNHLELSAIADTKANILLSVNAIIISVALSSLMPKLDNVSNSHLVIPTLILTISSVISIILSVLATRPNISNITVTRDMIKNKQTNILFFGNFAKMKLDEFEWGVDYLIENEEVLYNSLTKDLYFLGLVLDRKYRLLRITYNVFMAGIIISALAFFIAFFSRTGLTV